MATTLTLGDSVNYAQAMSMFRPQNIGVNNEPVITAGNLVMQTILGPPFTWNWNRAESAAITLSVGNGDYQVGLQNFGFIEKAYYINGLVSPSTTTEITDVKLVLTKATEQGSPNSIAAQLDDNAGNITFRILPVPDQVYTMYVIYQKRIPGLFTSLADPWAPIPDHMSYLYQYGFTALMLAYAQDPRWTQWNSKFVGAILGAQEGLEEEKKSIFLATWLDATVTMQQASGLKTSQGVQGRAL